MGYCRALAVARGFQVPYDPYRIFVLGSDCRGLGEPRSSYALEQCLYKPDDPGVAPFTSINVACGCCLLDTKL